MRYLIRPWNFLGFYVPEPISKLSFDASDNAIPGRIDVIAEDELQWIGKHQYVSRVSKPSTFLSFHLFEETSLDR